MNCLIIEDDELNRRLIEEYIRKTKGLTFVNSYSSPRKALNDNSTFDKIDVIFLDVEMPGMTGFDFIKSIDNQPIVILMSSKANYAVDAFSFEISDFLLKPIKYSRFLQAFNKIESIKKVALSTSIHQIENDSFFLKKNGSHFNVKYDDILYIEAMENYAIFNTISENYTSHNPLKTLEEKLPKHLFKRIHRSYIVNVKKIIKIEDTEMIVGNNEKLVAKIPIGKNFRSLVFNSLVSL